MPPQKTPQGVTTEDSGTRAVLVGVQLPGKTAVRLLDLLLGGVPPDPENRVIVGRHVKSSPLLFASDARQSALAQATPYACSRIRPTYLATAETAPIVPG